MKYINTYIVPHLNYGGIEKSLKSLRKYTPSNFRVILIDQSEKGRPDLEQYVDMRIRTNNLGFAKAMNLGIRLSDTEYCTCLNDDVEFINTQWWDGVMRTFERYGQQALGVNPASVNDPDGRGGKVIMTGFHYHEEWTEQEYQNLLKAGLGHIVDGICMWGPVFKRDRLDKILGVIPGKCWFDESYFPGGGEDYDLNRRAYLTCSICGNHRDDKHDNHDFKNYRLLGTKLGFCWHHWYSTKHPNTGKEGVKFDGKTFDKKWGTSEVPSPDIYGKNGNTKIPLNIIRDY